MGGDVLRAALGGADLRSSGSGNVGTTNALRTRGKAFAIGVLAVDVGKGVLAVTLIPALPWPGTGAVPWSSAAVACACGAAVALGHCYPVFQRFRGGKGVATLAGVFGVLLPWALPWMLGGFVLMLLISGYVSLSSLAAALIAVIWSVIRLPHGLLAPAGLLALAMAALLLFKHRENIARLCAGRESRFERARLLGRRLDRWRGR